MMKPLVLVFALLLFPALGDAQVSTLTKKLAASAASSEKSQRAVDKLDQQTRSAAEEYANNQRAADLLEAYNSELTLLVAAQRKEIQSLNDQIDSLADIESAALPLLRDMVEKLAGFVKNDLPFLPEERAQRIARLQRLLARADVSVAEKYRQIFEAYMVEVDYGRSMSAYAGKLEDGHGRQVRYLRLGRAALYYLSLDGLESGIWLAAEQRWQNLPKDKNISVQRAISVAEQRQVPVLLSLPLAKVKEQ